MGNKLWRSAVLAPGFSRIVMIALMLMLMPMRRRLRRATSGLAWLVALRDP